MTLIGAVVVSQLRERSPLSTPDSNPAIGNFYIKIFINKSLKKESKIS